MIQIIPINQFESKEGINIDNLPREILPFTTGISWALISLIALQHAADNSNQSFPISEEGLFVVLNNEKPIGYGSVVANPNVPPTAGIGLLPHCFIIPSERQKGHGTQLFKHLCQYAALHFGLLQLNKNCPFNNRMDGEYLDLTTMI